MNPPGPDAAFASTCAQPDGTHRITGGMRISDVVGTFPKAAGVLMSYGLHCVGCAASAFDTIEDGAKLHGMPDEEIERMIADLNQTINTRIETIALTARAIAKVRELRALERGKEQWPLRIAILAETHDGFSYEMDFDEQKPDDRTIEIEGIHVLIDPASFPRLKGSNIDYIESALGAGFQINNPNTPQSCGCGKHGADS